MEFSVVSPHLANKGNQEEEVVSKIKILFI